MGKRGKKHAPNRKFMDYKWLITVIIGLAGVIIALIAIWPPTDHGQVNVMVEYHPSGKIGDIGDVTVERDVGVDRFIYETKGRRPHEWDYKYVNGKLNEESAGFAGVMYLKPPNNWGMDPRGGLDLREVSNVVKWEARSLGEGALVEFVIGGVDWMWDEEQKQKTSPPYPDSMPRVSLGVKSLTKNWQSFEYSFSRQPKDHFTRVVGGFSWVITWGSNGVGFNEDRTGPEKPKTFAIEIRNIHYQRR